MVLLPLIAAAVVALPATPTLPAQLTLDEALRIFRSHGLDLIIADASVDSAEGDLKVAGAVPNPNLGLSYIHTFTYQPVDPDSCNGKGGTLCLADGFAVDLNDNAAIADSLSGKRGLRLKVARIALNAAKKNRVDAQRNLEFLVKQQYIQATLARDTLDFAREVQAAMSKTNDLTQLRYHAGAISEADSAKVEVAFLEADQAVATAEQALTVARIGLAFLLGVRGKVPEFMVDQDLPKFVVPPRLASPTLDSLLAAAYEHRPDLQSLHLQRERAEASVRLARRLRFPDIALGLNFSMVGFGGVGTNAPLQPPTLTLGLSAPLPLFYQQQGEIRRAEADRKTQTAQAARVEAQVTSDVNTALTNFSATRNLVERMEGRLLERSRKARDLIRLQYTKGAASLLEYLDAERTWIATNQEYLQDLAAYWIAVFQLEQATAMELR